MRRPKCPKSTSIVHSSGNRMNYAVGTSQRPRHFAFRLLRTAGMCRVRRSFPSSLRLLRLHLLQFLSIDEVSAIDYAGSWRLTYFSIFEKSSFVSSSSQLSSHKCLFASPFAANSVSSSSQSASRSLSGVMAQTKVRAYLRRESPRTHRPLPTA
ncbi:hypothetical protein MRB53_040393 [Persea americana]|nr:hypothetical protein MRB53_040393 [Persea americana]